MTSTYQLTKSVCVAYFERGSDRSLSEWLLLLLVKHSQSGNNRALQCLYCSHSSRFMLEAQFLHCWASRQQPFNSEQKKHTNI